MSWSCSGCAEEAEATPEGAVPRTPRGRPAMSGRALSTSGPTLVSTATLPTSTDEWMGPYSGVCHRSKALADRARLVRLMRDENLTRFKLRRGKYWRIPAVEAAAKAYFDALEGALEEEGILDDGTRLGLFDGRDTKDLLGGHFFTALRATASDTGDALVHRCVREWKRASASASAAPREHERLNHMEAWLRGLRAACIAGADLDQPNARDGSTPLELAVGIDADDPLRTLLEFGAYTPSTTTAASSAKAEPHLQAAEADNPAAFKVLVAYLYETRTLSKLAYRRTEGGLTTFHVAAVNDGVGILREALRFNEFRRQRLLDARSAKYDSPAARAAHTTKKGVHHQNRHHHHHNGGGHHHQHRRKGTGGHSSSSHHHGGGDTLGGGSSSSPHAGTATSSTEHREEDPAGHHRHHRQRATAASLHNLHQTAVGKACRYGHYRSLRLLLDAGASPDVVDAFERSPLHVACEYGYASCVRLLLEHGATPGRRDARGRTPRDHIALGRASRTVRRQPLEDYLAHRFSLLIGGGGAVKRITSSDDAKLDATLASGAPRRNRPRKSRIDYDKCLKLLTRMEDDLGFKQGLRTPMVGKFFGWYFFGPPDDDDDKDDDDNTDTKAKPSTTSSSEKTTKTTETTATADCEEAQGDGPRPKEASSETASATTSSSSVSWFTPVFSCFGSYGTSKSSAAS